MNVSSISLNSQIRLRPVSEQFENGVAIVGWGDQFLELPPEGLQFMGWLNEGLSLAEARRRFEAQFNPFSETEVFEVIEAFLEYDFIASVDGQAIALRHTPAGGKIHVSARRTNEGAEMSVSDTGEGIRTEDIPHVFESFFRGEKSRNRGTGGSGLGLAITRGILRAHGGDIRVESEPGKGTRFIFYIP